MHDLDERHVFAIPNFWQKSPWLEKDAELKGRSLFFTPELGVDKATASRCSSGPMAVNTVALEDVGFFRSPALGPAEHKAGQDSEQQPEEDAEPKHEPREDVGASPRNDESTSQIWAETQEPLRPRIGFRTWDSFQSRVFAAHQPMLISEAGPAAYDALLRQTTDCDAAVVQTRSYFSSLSALAVGRDSIFFTRDEKTQTFRCSLPSFRILGFSRQVLGGVQGQALRCGTCLSRLRAFVQAAYARNSGRCEVALASSIVQVLQAVERKLTLDGTRPRSLLQLQASIREVSVTLHPLEKLVSRLPRTFSDEDLVSLVFHTASAVDDGQDFILAIVRDVLQRVSAPWIEILEQWIGTKPDQSIFATKPKNGESKGFVKVVEESDLVDFRLDRAKVPDFMPDDLVALIFEAGRNLRFIRCFHPNHPLARQSTIESACPPEAQWLFDWQSILALESRVSQYRDNLCRALQEKGGSSQVDVGAGAPSTVDYFGLDQDGMEARILASIEQLNQAMAEPSPRDSLDEILHERFFGRHSTVDVDRAVVTPHWSLLPALSFGSIASAQAKIVNRESLRLLFKTHDIHGHLRLQRDFHLLGNGVFCSRLSHALFDPDLESAERRAGVARQGGVMGLRLGGRDTWPPASSELRLVLIGVLSESYTSQHGAGLSDHGALPGDLSFAVRELSAEEISKCMDADSVEALDFLRLSYTTPAALSGIITSASLASYDRIFKLLLRVLRVLYVVNQQWSWTRQDASKEPSRLAREAHHFVSSVASYFLDTGVAVPWQALEQRLDQMRAEVEGERAPTTKPQGPDQLREAHSQALERIMSALFLGERQKPVLALLDSLFSTILGRAKLARLRVLGGGATGDEAGLYAEFRDKMRAFTKACRRLSEDGGRGGDELVGQLLVKLDVAYFCSYHDGSA
ncbi:hypothetical protein XA68_12991 [Ophiocordyceps unilateralis]|uniref:Spindle pole body component n=1 Tax=Ophiocordyceps unilateralis TaxID=268505 RepID=A0A2A9PND5_OPHUN|nr:hypothetical protein XA68_12991 [Ophiocordyceps unilateralis]